jgi:general secretion pathway protein B
MSYILDALRRADAERERGGVPGLHAQPQRGEPGDDGTRRPGLPWAGIAVALGLALAVVFAWLLMSGGPAAPAPPEIAALPPPPPAPPPAPPAAPPLADAAVLPPQRPALPPPTPVPLARPARSEPEVPAVKKTAPATVAAAASAAAPAPRIPALKELPEDLRRQIPALSVGGSTWSESAASRFVIINGQLFRENDALAPELTLRLIRQRSAILEFRGQRFELGF